MNHPIFIIGTERSGSNLLRMLLNAHVNIRVPHPPHILKYFFKLAPFYEKRYGPSAVTKMLRDILTLIKIHIYPWETVLDEADLLADRPKTVFDLFYSIYDRDLKNSGKKRWACKSTFVIEHTDKILETYPHAKFLYLVRDVRDVVASSKKSVFNPFHSFFTASLWRDQQKKGRDAIRVLGAETLMLVKYEDLVSKSEETLKQVCQFLDETYRPEMFDYHIGEEAKKSQSLSESWKNTGRPIQKNNSGKYKKELSTSEISLIESLSEEEMKYFDYQLQSSPAELLQREVTPREYLFFRTCEFLMHAKIEIKSLFKDKNHFRRWGRTFFLLYLEVKLKFLVKK